MFRFIHAADIHLDSSLVGLNRYESAPVEAMRSATRRAFENLVGLAIEEDVKFVLLAGDLYDGDWKDFRTGLFFVDQMARLREARIPVFVVAGNHDAQSQLTKHLRSPDNVRFFSTRRPETHVLDDCGVAVHGQGFATRSVTDDLAAAYPVGERGMFHIGLLHTSLDGREGHADYAPTSAQRLAQKGYHYWALGHVHKREVISTDPWIVFPGNLQGRHARETGPKGCTLVTVDDGVVTRVEERFVDVARWAVCRIDTTGVGSTDEVLDRVSHAMTAEADQADGRAVAVRVEIFGAAACHGDLAADSERWTHEIRALASATSSAEMWVEKVSVATTDTTDIAALAARDDALGSFLRDLQAASSNAAEAEALRAALADVRGALPRELLEGDGAFDPCAPHVLARLIHEARDLLLARISHRGVAS